MKLGEVSTTRPWLRISTNAAVKGRKGDPAASVEKTMGTASTARGLKGGATTAAGKGLAEQRATAMQERYIKVCGRRSKDNERAAAVAGEAGVEASHVASSSGGKDS